MRDYKVIYEDKKPNTTECRIIVELLRQLQQEAVQKLSENDK